MQDDEEFLAYGGFGGAMKRLGVLYEMPEAEVTEGVSIDDYDNGGPCALQIKMDRLRRVGFSSYKRLATMLQGQGGDSPPFVKC